MFNWLENIDKNYANAIQALTPFVKRRSMEKTNRYKIILHGF